jgi:hypothetical protein
MANNLGYSELYFTLGNTINNDQSIIVEVGGGRKGEEGRREGQRALLTDHECILRFLVEVTKELPIYHLK